MFGVTTCIFAADLICKTFFLKNLKITIANGAEIWYTIEASERKHGSVAQMVRVLG